MVGDLILKTLPRISAHLRATSFQPRKQRRALRMTPAIELQKLPHEVRRRIAKPLPQQRTDGRFPIKKRVVQIESDCGQTR